MREDGGQSMLSIQAGSELPMKVPGTGAFDLKKGLARDFGSAPSCVDQSLCCIYEQLNGLIHVIGQDGRTREQ